MGRDAAPVDLNNRLADGQPQPDAGNGGLLIPTGELIKDSLFLTRRNAGTVIPHLQLQLFGRDAGMNADLRSAARVFPCVLQQVNQHPLEQWAVHVDQRQRIGHIERDMPATQTRFQRF